MRFIAMLPGLLMLIAASNVAAFCGFYVASADGALTNQASRVVFVRDRQNSTITMLSDYQGSASEFAMIVPTPYVLKREQVRTVDVQTVDHLSAYSAPRLTEYFDDDPCNPAMTESVVVEDSIVSGAGRAARIERYRGAAALGVTIKEEYAVGDYDIQILAAEQSDGLLTYLTGEGYKVPEGAGPVLQSYITMKMKFFVAKVNLSRHSATKAQELPPLQISFKSRDFMLPIQLGKLNGGASQDLLLMTLTRTGQVRIANYGMERLPTDAQVPVFVKQLFPDFYRRLFDRAVGKSGVALEYAWDMAFCDPCAAAPMTNQELQALGVSWLKGGDNAGQDVFVTRLHVRYSQETMPEDLMLSETRDKSNFQGRYFVRNPFVGALNCPAGQDYLNEVRARLREEAVTVQSLTGWDPRKIEKLVRKGLPASYW